MSSGNGPWGPMPAPPGALVRQPRPKLDLGPMGGTPDYLIERSESLIRSFSSLLGKEFRLENYAHGCTDCQTFIRAPFMDPELYLIVEHEISHPLFGTDLALTEAFRLKAVERLLKRAKMKAAHPDAAGYKKKLDQLVHHLWNILEDHRVRWLWAQLYPGGGELLRQRWHDISKFENVDNADTDLLTYLGRKAAGVETDTASDKFKACGKFMWRAKNLVEGVDAGACLAITARLIDDIADELLDKYPPNKTEENKQKLKALCGSVNPDPDDEENSGMNNPIGGRDIVDPPGRKKKPTAAQMKRVQQILTAKDTDENEHADGKSTFDAMLDAGGDRMEARLEAARVAMATPKLSKTEEKEDILQSACRVTGSQGKFVEPTQSLPSPSPTAYALGHHLQRVKMRKKRKLHDEGTEIDIEAFIAAKVNQELDEAKIFTKTTRESGMDLLLLADGSGSMLGTGLTLVDQAVADIEFACLPMKVKLNLWIFSDITYFLTKIGSSRRVQGLSHGLTNMVQALDVAYEWAKDAPSTRAIILMTDGMPTSLRGRRSTGNVLEDLHDTLTEMRQDSITLSVLAIGPESSKDNYDAGFGEGKYALLPNISALRTALPNAAQQLVEAYIKKGST